MQNSFDIAIGRCQSVTGKEVVVELDTAMVSRLVPGHPWHRSGTSKLKLAIELCSAQRPPQPGCETFLNRDAILKNPSGRFDLLGDGQFIAVRLKALAANTEPELLEPAPKLNWAERRVSRSHRG
ncbi:hypothetical protein [Lysobacter enzymogenes]|uniref:hypothetical protein n=1 Tax=Lysobacter enzymogenes TaxID=69 RepID=UPI00099B3254|nr:hypothetical protein [Lysobacter enzymogenes]UZW63040.1 hypothetical protein BV903_012470 [Lysobacter enzymogenes]